DVRLFEAAADLGGRARTKSVDGFSLNQGPHALYLGGAFKRELDRLGIPYGGSRALGGTRQAIWRGKLHDLPVSAGSLAMTRLFRIREKLAFARVFKAVTEGATGEGSFAHWLEVQKLPPVVRASLEALGRLSGYTNGSEHVSAAAILDQIRLALVGTLYLDGGWSSVVEGLAHAAREAGVEINTGVRVERLRVGGRQSRLVMADGAEAVADATILALGPHEAAMLAPTIGSLALEAHEAMPVRANALDLALSRMPDGAHDFALGVDEPFYLSLHSRSAKLAPAGGAVVHVAKYLPVGEMPARDAIAELEAVADLVMPGWRAFEVRRQELRGMIVSNGLPRWDRARPDVALADAPGVFIAGDWVGREGMIADAAAASAVEAAREAASWLSGKASERSAA
ncbi:MAG: FAD-dependent oxidoreductase, partial [Sphingomonadales bacterium]